MVRMLKNDDLKKID